ncbi:MAG: hypothetical protein LDL33_15245 [Desulfomonile sp.]|nr:hypothetical protein [Desulfomonile sp.]
MRTVYLGLCALVAAIVSLFPDPAVAAGGGAEMLVVVADKRMVDSEITKYLLDVYNVNPFLMGVWCTILTAALGVTLGFLTDQIMKRTGIDLTSRKIVEH